MPKPKYFGFGRLRKQALFSGIVITTGMGDEQSMPKRHLFRGTAVLCLLIVGATWAPFAAGAPAWVAKSDVNAGVLLEATAKFQPEFAASTGLSGYDDRVADLQPQVYERYTAAVTGARDELVRRAATETDPLVSQDLSILIKAANKDLKSEKLRHDLLLAYGDVGQMIFQGEFALLQDQIDAKRRPSALVRLRRYTGLEAGYTPAIELAKARFLESASDPSRIGPFKGQVEKHLASVAQYTAGVRKLYAKYGIDKLDGAGAALDAFEKQMADYSAWVRATVLPRARADFRLPPAIYADNLANFGIDITPEELMAKAEVAFAEIRNEMRTLAPLVAKEHGFADPDYRAVIRELKKEQLARDQIGPWYHEVLGHIEDTIRKEDLISLPTRQMMFRVASDAESAAQPAPHMQPPPLINNKGERGTFVLTMGIPSSPGAKESNFDDFTFKAAAWTLTAHEGRPGHELQFSAMVEQGVSLARSLYAFNSVNVEGWALYCEAEMKPYEPLDGQLIALLQRMMRATRAIVDPMLNLGLISPERAHQILTEDVCCSEALAQEEIERFTFRMPGQATSYFYGYQKLMELRTATEVALGPKFNHKAFNDFVVNQGLLPPSLLAKAVREEFVAPQLAKP